MDTFARTRSRASRGAVIAAAALALAAALTLAALPGPAAATPSAAPQTWTMPRTADGRPDLQGNWTNATMTPIVRPPGLAATLTPEEAAQWEAGALASRAEDYADSDPDREAPPVGGIWTGNPLFDAASGGTGGYNSFFIDSGEKVAVFNGEPRTSLIVDPPNGQLPTVTDEGRKRLAARRSLSFDNPEDRPLAERCLMSFGSNAGPPMLPNYFYNNNYTIVQTPDHVMIMTEMVHDARIIRLGEPRPLPAHIRPWMGDSWGRWEGDTLVVETTNLHPAQTLSMVGPAFPPSEDFRVVERFTRADEHTINYEFTVEDPKMWPRPWSGEAPFKRLDGLVYEYACHEGNYAMENVLRGARAEERKNGGDR